MEQILNQEQEKKQQEEKSSSSSVVSTAMLCPVLEDDILMCPHGGQVQLKSNKGKPFKSQGVPLILEPDLINAPISGCSNNILGVPLPCTMVAVIPPATLSLKKLNGEKAVMQDYVSLIMTDKGFPLQIIPKPNKWKLAYSLASTNRGNGESSESENEEYEYIFHIRYCLSKSYPYIINGAYYIKIYNSSVENQSAESKEYQFRESDYDNPYKISLGKVKESDTGIYSELLDYLKKTYIEDIYSYKAISLEIGANIFEYIFLVPKKKKYESSFGFLETGETFSRMYENEDEETSIPVITKIYKTSRMFEEINLVIS